MKLILYWKVSKGWTICQGLTGRRSELSFHNAFMVSSAVSKRLLLQKVRRNAEEIEIAIGTVITFQEACVISLLFWAFP